MPPTSIKSFTFILIAQTISIFGSALTAFALGVWVFNEVGSATIYAMIALANGIPLVLLSPFAGTVVDRLNRKLIIVSSQLAACAITALLMLLYWTELLRPWHIIALVALNSAFLAFVLPAVTATIPLMVPKNQLTRANGMMALAFGIVQLASPAISGAMYQQIGLKTIFLFDLATFAVGISAIVITFIPQPHNTVPQRESLLQSLKTGYRFITASYSLSWTIVFYSIVVAILMSMGILIQPMILALTDAQTMGFIMSFAASGMLVGSVLMLFMQNINRHMPIILTATLIAGLGCALTPMVTTPWMLAAGGFFIMCCFPVFDGNNRALLQRKIDPAILGRVIGWRNFALGVTQSLLLLASGMIADAIFEPGMSADGFLTNIFGALYGIGQGRGIAVFISLLGVLIIISAALAWVSAPIRQMDSLMPDHEEPEEHNAQPAQNLFTPTAH